MQNLKKEKLTYEELHKNLIYSPWTGLFYWKINKSKVTIWNIAGHKDIYGYITIKINSKLYKAHRLAWFYAYGYMPENIIDHEDRIRHHNWIKNLREASDQCSVRNRGIFKNNTSGVTGVSWAKRRNKWYVQICVNRKYNNLGYFKDFDEAVCTRLAGEQCVGWDGCDSNSPAYRYVKENI